MRNLRHIRRISLILLILSGVLPSMGSAQTGWLKVEVTDGGNGEPLEKATIVLDDADGGYSDARGIFIKQVAAGKHSLSVRYLGYDKYNKQIEVPLNDTAKVEVSLLEEGADMEVVVISSSQYEKRLVEETVSIEVIDKKLVANNNSIELGEAIDKSVGVQAQDGQITIRGGSAYTYGVGSRTSILVDGLPFTSADLGEGQLKLAPLEIMDQIEVIKGAASVVYGSSALNGVVNMRTLWPTQKQPRTEITQFQGIYGKPPRPEMRWWPSEEQPAFSGMFFNHTQKFGNLDLVLGGNYFYNNSFLEKGDERRFRGNFKTRYHSKKIKGMHFGVNGNFMNENSGRFYLASHMIDEPYRRGDGSFDRYTRFNVDPHFTYFTEGGSIHRMIFRYMFISRWGNGNDPDAISNFMNIDYQFRKKISDSWHITAGAPLSLGVAKSNIFEGVRMAWSGAGYVQGEFKTERLTVVGGMRYEGSAVDVVFSTVLPVFRMGVNYRLGKATFFRGSFGQAYRLPTIGERFVTAEFSVLNIVPNPDLESERGWGQEFGIRQGLAIGKWRGYADFAVFVNEYKNFVEYTMGFYTPTGEPSTSVNDLGLKPINVDNARIAGLEASVFGRGKIGPVGLRTLVGYTYNYPGHLDRDTLQRDWGVYLSNAIAGMTQRYDDVFDEQGRLIEENSTSIMNFRMRHLFKGDVELSWKRWMVGYNFNVASFPERFEFLFLAAVPGTLEYIQTHKTYDAVHNIRLGWQATKVVRLTAVIKNLTNHEYFVRPGRMEPPRNFTLQLNFVLDGKQK